MQPAAAIRGVSDVFAAALEDGGTREALVTRSGTWSYGDLDDLCERGATVLHDLGVRAGDRVAASLPNDVDILIAFHATMRIGAMWVGINRPLAPPEKQFILGDCGATVVIADEEVAVQLGQTGEPSEWRIVRDDEWRQRLEAASPRASRERIDPFAPAAIAYTSGTTGYPKGAVHTQHNLMLAARATVESRGYGPQLRKGDCLPLTILNMVVLTTLVVAEAGGCCVIMDRIDAQGVAGWIRDHRVSTWNGPPALLHSLVADDSIEPESLGSLDEVWTGGADCPEALRERFEAKFGLAVLATYGLTEAPTLVSIDPRSGDHRPGASGRAMPHVEVTVRSDDGQVLDPGETGEICVGPRADGPWAGLYRTMLGYWKRTDASAEALRAGVLHTGDIGCVDADGFLTIRDRKSLVILRGGANVYPAEVERVIHQLDGVAGCAVVGIPDERLGERVVAVIERSPAAAFDADAVRDHCLGRLARYKVPERVAFIAELPRNAMGKISRRDLGALFDRA